MTIGLIKKAILSMLIFCLALFFIYGKNEAKTTELSRKRWERSLRHIVVTKTDVDKLNASTWNEQVKRRNILEEYCKKQKKQLGGIGHIYLNKKYKILYCQVSKIASTTWKKVFLMFDQRKDWNEANTVGKVEAHHSYRYTQINAKNLKGNQLYKDYYSFFISRHPFERLVSAFRNKSSNPYPHPIEHVMQHRDGKKILQMFRKNLTKEENAGLGVRFDEFVKFIIKKQWFDVHWAPVVNVCQPCSFNFSYIAKMDTLIPDSKMILVNAGLKDKIMFPEATRDMYKTKSVDIMQKEFENVSKTDVLKLYDMYKNDFEAFGYKIPKYLL